MALPTFCYPHDTLRDEYNNLRQVIPSLRIQRNVSKIEVVSEAARYIDHLHRSLIEKFATVGIPANLKGLLRTDNPNDLDSDDIKNLVTRLATSSSRGSMSADSPSLGATITGGNAAPGAHHHRLRHQRHQHHHHRPSVQTTVATSGANRSNAHQKAASASHRRRYSGSASLPMKAGSAGAPGVGQAISMISIERQARTHGTAPTHLPYGANVHAAGRSTTSYSAAPTQAITTTGVANQHTQNSDSNHSQSQMKRLDLHHQLLSFGARCRKKTHTSLKVTVGAGSNVGQSATTIGGHRHQVRRATSEQLLPVQVLSGGSRTPTTAPPVTSTPAKMSRMSDKVLTRDAGGQSERGTSNENDENRIQLFAERK